MTGFDAELCALDEAALAVRRAAMQLRHDRDDVHQRVAGFLGHGWTGQAADSFVDAWRAWWNGSVDVLEGLDAMSALLAVTREDYAAVDAGSAGRVTHVADRLAEALG